MCACDVYVQLSCVDKILRRPVVYTLPLTLETVSSLNQCRCMLNPEYGNVSHSIVHVVQRITDMRKYC